MRIIALVFITLCLYSNSYSQGRGDQIFDESYIHKIRITSTLDLQELSELFFGQLGSGEYSYTLAEVNIDGNILDSIGIRVKGGLSAFDPKKPLKLDFNYFVKGQKYDGLKKINLHQGSMDQSFVRESVTYGLLRNAGVKTSRTSFTKVYLNDEYQGIYTLVEQIDDNFIKDRFASNDGALYKTEFGFLTLKYGIDEYLVYDEFESAVNDIPTDQLHVQLPEYLDVESLLRFYATSIFVNAVDGPFTVDENYYIYYEPKAGTYVYVPWDYNLSLYGGANHSLVPNGSANFIMNRLFGNPTLKALYLDIFCQLLQYNFDEDRLQDLVTTYKDLLSDEVPNDPYINLIGNWDDGLSSVRDVIASRYESLTSELNIELEDCPELVNPIAPLNVVINEIVASNDTHSEITDPAGGFADWIEFYNNTSEEISLDGYYLSNDKDVLKHWKFPKETTIAANDYLIVWADRDLDEEGLHTDFKLNKTNGELYLSYEDGELVDEVFFMDQETNVGYARVPNGVGEFSKQEATFGKTNDISTAVKDDIVDLRWYVFPNPIEAGSDINIFNGNNQIANLQIIDMNGVKKWESKVNLQQGNNTIRTSEIVLTPGMYILKRIDSNTHKSKYQYIAVF